MKKTLIIERADELDFIEVEIVEYNKLPNKVRYLYTVFKDGNNDISVDVYEGVNYKMYGVEC